MAFLDREIDITRNIKTVDWIKSELLTDTASLYKLLVNAPPEGLHDEAAETLANMVLMCYLLGRRLGVSYNTIDLKLRNLIRLGLLDNHVLEKYYGDLSELSKHLDASRGGK